MKLDENMQIWYAWQEGNSSKLALLIRDKLGPEYTARLPSARWKHYNEKSKSIIIKALMLANDWSMYMPLNSTASLYWAFTREGGPPAVSIGKLPYRNYIVITD